MNKIEHFWSAFCESNQLQAATYQDAFQFGVEADWLADLVVQGKKTATTSGFVFYELENEKLPEAGEYYIVLNAKDEPVAVIQVESVEVLPMNKVSETFALAEGEGDYQYWWKEHEAFFTNALQAYGKTFSPDMRVVCETFRKMFPTEE